jgi:hypothetical protein
MSELRTSSYFLFFYFEANEPNKIYTGMIRQCQKSGPELAKAGPMKALKMEEKAQFNCILEAYGSLHD